MLQEFPHPGTLRDEAKGLTVNFNVNFGDGEKNR